MNEQSMQARYFSRAFFSYLEKIEEAKRRKASHDQLRHLFIGFLSKAFNVQYEDIELERGIKAVQVRGFIDLLFQHLIFEFKRNLEAEREKGKEELSRYISSRDAPDQYFGILTDGVRFEVYVLRDGRLQLTDHIELHPERSDEASLWLDSYLFAQKNIAPTADDIVRRFGERSAVFVTASHRLQQMLWRVRQEPSIDVKQIEWNNLLAKVYGSQIGSVELFIRHTYLSFVARLLVYAALRQHHPSSQDLAGMIDGQTFKKLGFSNLVEEDFFAWVLHPEIHEDALALLNALSYHLHVYDLSRINEDLLKELYQELVDPETRHDLGEFYTPDWVAELALREAGFPSSKDKSLLDPACGSGTFLFTAIRLIRESGLKDEKLIRFAFENIAGVDVHPLAVSIAKVNFLLALAPELQKLPPRKLHPIPIHMADSLVKPEPGLADDVIPIPVSEVEERKSASKRKRIKTKERPFGFWIPIKVAKQPPLLDAVIDEMIQLARQKEEKKETLLAGFKQKLSDLGVAFSSDWAHNLKLMQKLFEKERDTIWAFILKNAYRPLYFAERKFAFVVGNPPWLAYRYIESRDYQQQIKALVLDYGLLSRSDVKLFTQMDTSTVFYAHCYDKFLTKNGTLAFVMPKSVLTGAKQHEKFQSFGFVKVIDVEGVSPLFNVPACVLVSKKAESKSEDIPMLVVSGKLPRKNVTLTTARLTRQRTSYTPPRAAAYSPYYERFLQGATIVPRNLWFVRPPAEAWVIDPKRPYLETDPEVDVQAKKPWKGIKLEGDVEAKFLYATLLSTHLVPFGYRQLNLVVLPIQVVERKVRTDQGKTVVTKQTELLDRTAALKQGATGLVEWLKKAEKLWEQNKKATTKQDIYQWLDYRRKLTSQHPTGCYKIIYNTSGTHIAACVVDTARKKPLQAGRLPTNGLLAEMVTYCYETKSKDEAHYLCAVLNAPLVNEAIKTYQPRGQWGERHITRLAFQVLPIPEFDKDNPQHQRLAELSQECHRKIAKLPFSETVAIGRLRNEVRKLLAHELREIDKITKKILGNPSLPQKPRNPNSNLELPLKLKEN